MLEGMLGSVKKYELWVLGALLLLGVVLWLRRRFKNARIAREECAQAKAREAAETASIEAPVEQTESK
ncbi:hypothetical protein AO260_17280 [Pseudomonas sp. ABAC21]|nr:hypothetical protein AO260_17280 [Pseudomonas sp. ABAC21]